MHKIPLIFAILALLQSTCHAQQTAAAADATRVDQRNPTNTGPLQPWWLVPLPGVPSGYASAIYVFDGPNTVPRMAYIGSGLTYNGGWGGTVGIDSSYFATVAFSGAYNDLTGKPALGTAASQNSTAFATASQGALADTALQPGTAQSNIANLPADLAGKQSLIPIGTTSQFYRGDKTWNQVTTTDVSGLSAALAAKFNAPTGLTTEYIRGDGSLAAFPTNLSSFTNGPGYITGISSGMVMSALGYTPYNGATNPNSYITLPQARAGISLTTTGTGAASYSNATGVLNIPTPASPTAPTQNDNVARTLNSNYTISTTQRTRCYYSINIQWALASLLSGNGTAFLEYSTNGGSSWTTVNNCGKTLALLTISGSDDLNLVGEVPANALVRIRTTATNMNVTYSRGQEVLY